MTVHFIYYRLQKSLIEIVKNEDIYHRVKADLSIEFAKKWKDRIFDLFNQPSLTVGIKPAKYQEYVTELSQHNIPFYAFVIDGKYTLVTSDTDSVYIAENIEASNSNSRGNKPLI